MYSFSIFSRCRGVIVLFFSDPVSPVTISVSVTTGELGYDGPLYDGLLAMTDDMLGPSPMHINYVYFTMHRTDSV